MTSPTKHPVDPHKANAAASDAPAPPCHRRKIDCAGNAEITDRRHFGRGGGERPRGDQR